VLHCGVPKQRFPPADRIFIWHLQCSR
jgi:hypothetical protein